MWAYEEALGWLYGRQARGIKLGLDKVRRLLAQIGDPQDRFHSVHVAGTNGKGSVTALLSEALRRAGHDVGHTTSPHLVRFTERIEINGRPVTRGQVAKGLWTIRPAVERLDEEGEDPTFFEVVTTLAFHLFAEAGVEWAVVETGMGGRLDATNVLQPRLTIITNVAEDHQEHLGRHIGDIATEKGGIMKPGVPCITGATADALVVLKVLSHRFGSPMSILHEDYHVRPDINGIRLVRPGGESHYRVGLAGEHQLENAALAVAAVDALRTQGVAVPERAVQEAIAKTRFPGRLEMIRCAYQDLCPDDPVQPHQDVEVLLDGAHNPAAARSLRRHLGHLDWTGFHLVTGFNRDKAWQQMLQEWVPLAAQVWGVPLRNPRTLDPEQIVDVTRGVGIPFKTAPDARTALQEAARAGATRIVVAGSLFLVGEARAHLTGQPMEEIRGEQ